MNIEEVINILKKYISFSEKECNFPSIWDWNWHMDLANDIETLLTAYEKEKELLELASNMLDNIDYDQIPIAIGELKSELEKEKEKNKKAIDFINERNKTVNKDMAEGTRLQVGTFMWQVDELLEILKEE